MPISINFTQDRIRELPAPEKGRVDYYDSGCPKLTCRVSDTGNKSFVVLKKTANGKTQRVTLGRFPDMSVSDARKKAQAALVDLANGIDPAEEKRKQRLKAMTLQELLDRYLSDKTALREYSVLDYTNKINQGFPDWLNKPINEITRDMVLARRKQLTGGIDNKMRVLRLLMHYAVNALKALDENPVDALKDGGLWSKPTRRTRMIPSDNIKEWYQAVLNLDNEQAKVYLLLLLHTGLRDQDIRYLEWCDVDFKNDCFIARDTKNHKDFTAYLAPQIKPYLRALQGKTGNSRYVFPGFKSNEVMEIPKDAIKKVCKQSGVTFSSHDLKRTFLTIGEHKALLPLNLLRALANHKTDNDVTGGYIHHEANTFRQSAFKVADAIQRLTTADDDKVVLLQAPKPSAPH
ncbi:MAG: tyrosine-type recombinase/integrase [Methylobacter sp.]